MMVSEGIKLTILTQQVTQEQDQEKIQRGIKWHIPGGEALLHHSDLLLLIERADAKSSKIYQEEYETIREMPVRSLPVDYIMPFRVIGFDPVRMAQGLGIGVAQLERLARNGKFLHPILEATVCPTDRERLRLITPNQEKNSGGVNIGRPSLMGSGRIFDTLLNKNYLSEIDSFLIADGLAFPNIPIWRVPTERIYSILNGHLCRSLEISGRIIGYDNAFKTLGLVR